MDECIQKEKEMIDEQCISTNSIEEQVKGDSYIEEQIKIHKFAKEKKKVDQHTVRYIPSPDPIAIVTSQVFRKDYEMMPLESPRNIYEARIYNYSKVENYPSKKQEKSKFVSQVKKSQSIPAISSSIDSHDSLTCSNKREIDSENDARYSESNETKYNFNMNDHNYDEPQALNLEVEKVCKLETKYECSVLQTQKKKFISKMDISNIKKTNEDEIRKNTDYYSQDEKSKYYESVSLLRKTPISNEIDLITNEGTLDKEDPNFKICLHRSSRVPKRKNDSEEMYENDIDASSMKTKLQHIMKISNTRTEELWECNHCEAVFRTPNSLMCHHNRFHLFTCSKCNWQGYNNTDYEIHMSTLHLKEVKRCIACREEFSSYNVYKEHMIKDHKTFIDSVKDSSGTVNQPLPDYPKSSENISMQNKLLPDNIKRIMGEKRECEEIFQTNPENSVSEGIERTSLPVTGNKKCQYCPKSFMRQSRLIRHLNYHLGKKSFVCSVCKKSFVEKSGLDAHMVTHNPVNAACKHCEKVFKTQRTLKRHLQTHKNRKYVCELCGKVFRHMESLRVHKLTHNEGGSGNTCEICNKDCKTQYYLQVHVKTKHESAKFECKDCQKFFKWKQSFTKHKQLFHDDPDNDLSTDSVAKNLTLKSKVECADCLRPFSSMSELLKHQVSHRKEAKHTCDLCGKEFKHAYTRDKHIKTVHKESNEHNCPQCGAKFKAKEYLDQHISYVHTTKDRIKCGQCENDFKTKANLKGHIKTVHGHKKRKYICKKCKKSFTSPKDLGRHQKIHTKVRDFQCPACQRSFSRKDNMTAHLRIHTEPIAKPPANRVSFESPFSSYVTSSENQISSNTNEATSVNTESSQNVCEPITLTLPGNDIIVGSSQTSPNILSQSQMEISPSSTTQYNCSLSSNITSVNTMPHQMITTVSPGIPLGKDINTSTATCILTVPNTSLSSSPNLHTVPTPTSIATSFIDISNGSSIESPSSVLPSTSSSPINALTSSSLSSLKSSTVLPVTHVNKDSDSSIEVEVMPDLPRSTDHSVLQQDNVFVAEGILPLSTPTQTHFSQPHVVYTILEDGSSKLETLESLSIHPLSPGSNSEEVEITTTKHKLMDSLDS